MINQTAKMDDVPKIDFLMKKSSELLAEMRRVDRENQKNRKRGDVLQKERDNSRSDLSKQVQLKEKLEKLCRELQKDNNKLKVRITRQHQHCFRRVNCADTALVSDRE
jgi:STE24 endopeptidase